MKFKISKSDKYHWTQHALFKMEYYNLSPQRIKRVIKSPQRIEEGIVENTIAVMQPVSLNAKNGKKRWTSEIWAMYQIKARSMKLRAENNLLNNQKQVKIISVWRYPGVSPKRDPIPLEILEEIKNL